MPQPAFCTSPPADRASALTAWREALPLACSSPGTGRPLKRARNAKNELKLLTQSDLPCHEPKNERREESERRECNHPRARCPRPERGCGGGAGWGLIPGCGIGV